VGDLDDIIMKLEPLLGPLAGAPVELDGGITNRNLRVALGGGEYVLRCPGAGTELLGIDRESERAANEAAAALGIAPAVAAAPEGCLVTRFVACRPLRSREPARHVREIARALRRFHDCGVRLPSEFSVPALLDRYAAIASAHAGTLPDDYEHARAVVARIVEALPREPARPCHNDLLAANLILAADGGEVLIVDWEYAGMGDARFDLGNLSVNNDFDAGDDERLLHAYHGRAPAPSERAALALMRVASDAREGAWGVVQAHVSELDFDFAGYAREHFARMRAASEDPGFERALAQAAGAREAQGEHGGQAA
jgi:thiamine kinase-like enzyme